MKVQNQKAGWTKRRNTQKTQLQDGGQLLGFQMPLLRISHKKEGQVLRKH